jgi:molybdopterin converting factor small subunit
MAVKVIVPTPLRQYVGRQDSVEIEAKTVAEVLAGLTSQYGELRRHLFTEDGKIRSFVNIYLNDEDIRYLQKDQTPVHANDVISIVPSIAGGGGSFELRHSDSRLALRCICT